MNLSSGARATPGHSRRVRAMQQPMIPVVSELIRRTPGCISLGQGVVWWGPPQEALHAIDGFLADASNHKYRSVEGIPELLTPVRAKLSTENGIHLNDREVMVTAGSNMAFSHAIKAIADPGDEIILPVPYYFNHEMAVAMAGCQAVLVPTDSTYNLRLDMIDSAITHRTRAVVTVSPNNPTGAVYPESSLRDLNELCRRRGIYHIHDEAYEYFVHDEASTFSPASIPGSEEHTFALYSMSKAYGFASWRVGYMVIPEHLAPSIRKIQDTTLICAPVISQFAAATALQVGRAYCEANLAETRMVRNQLLAALNEIEDVCQVAESSGAFYLLLKLHTDLLDMTVVERLIREYGIGVMPGSTFGLEVGCHVRVSYGPLRSDCSGAAIDRLMSGLTGVLKS